MRSYADHILHHTHSPNVHCTHRARERAVASSGVAWRHVLHRQGMLLCCIRSGEVRARWGRTRMEGTYAALVLDAAAAVFTIERHCCHTNEKGWMAPESAARAGPGRAVCSIYLGPLRMLPSYPLRLSHTSPTPLNRTATEAEIKLAYRKVRCFS